VLGKYAYVPVLFFSGEDGTKNQEVLGKPSRFWTWWHEKESVFYHPFFLLNAFSSLKIPNQRNDLDAGSDVRVLVDSGGFQIYQQTIKKGIKLNIDPLEILRWQEVNGNVAFGLDWPVGTESNDEEYEHGLSETIKNYQIYRDNLKKPELRILKILHGHTPDRVKKWYEEISKIEFPCEGYSFGWHPSSDVFGQSRMLAFLLSVGFRGYLHFLGVSGWNTSPIIIYASRFMSEVVNDSSSYATGYKTKSYTVPYDLGKQEDICFGDRLQSWHELTQPPCCCPVCTVIRDSGQPLGDVLCKSESGGHLISLHNLWLFVERSKKLYSLVADKERYFKYVHENCSPETYMALQYIDEVLRIGFDDATQEYSRWHKRTGHDQMTHHFGKIFMSGDSKPKEKPVTRLPKVEKEGQKRGRKKKVVEQPQGLNGGSFATILDSLPLTNLGLHPVILTESELLEVSLPHLPLKLKTPKETVNLLPLSSEELARDSFGWLHKAISESSMLPNLSETDVANIRALQSVSSEELTKNVPLNPFGQLHQGGEVLPKKKREHKIVNSPTLLALEETSVVSLHVIVEKPECFGGYEQSICDGSFCPSVFEECKSGGTK